MKKSLNEQFEIEDLRHISIFVGAYGSGKSEVSVNFARWLKSTGHETILCDLDTINPYYRSADARDAVEQLGIRLISPTYAGTNVDVPAVPGEIYSVIDNDQTYSVLDIGGEDMGARVVSSLRLRLAARLDEVRIYMVVNPYRPFTDTPDKICGLAGTLSEAAGMPISGLVHNANLLESSTADMLPKSYPIIRESADKLGLPIVFASALDHLVPDSWKAITPDGLPLLRLSRSIWYPDARK